ncbi:hypothetical protein Syun_010025 [Stephania yunnanensis]|uniref:glucan endo-1,3-beta-D-glucosidase n=1 Tax=Stephania yunnanensis TaxID=152371 RepID=A0AAP0KFN2_9MAGN
MAHSLSSLLFLLSSLLLTSGQSQVQKKQQQKEPFVGVNIGTEVSNLLPPKELVTFLKFQKITHIRLYDANPPLLQALAGTGISVVVGIPNNQILSIGSSNATAANWVSRNILPFFPQTLITAIAVGDELLTTVPSSSPTLLPAIQFIHQVLVSLILDDRIKISTPHSQSIILDPFPPSQAFFNQTLVSPILLPLLQFLSKTRSPLMLNLYPYYVFMQNKGLVPINNSLMDPLPPSKEMVDPNTLLHYTNVFDAMIDAAYFSMKNLNITDVPVLVTESGWPSNGDSSREPFATAENAEKFNSNLIKHVMGRAGSPVHPEITSSVYIYELFNEDLRRSPVSEAYWGLFNGDGTPSYLLSVANSGSFLASDTRNKTYCVARGMEGELGVDLKSLQAGLDWACGVGRANCSEIQPGELCYQPNDVRSHASYAFDSYYQSQGRSSGACDFNGLAVITTTDPSHGSCIFPGSKKMVNKTTLGSTGTNTTNGSGPILAHSVGAHSVWAFVVILTSFAAMNFVSSWTFW